MVRAARPSRPQFGLIVLFTALVATSVILLTSAITDSRSVGAQADATYYVSPTGNDADSGAENAPFLTLGRAVKVAEDGATIKIAAGVYHEQVQVYRKQLTIEGEPGADVVLDGASRVSNWFAEDGAWWTSWNTAGERVGPPWVLPGNLLAGAPEMVWADGKYLKQVNTRAELVADTFFHDVGAKRIWVAEDPSSKVMELADLQWGIYLNEANDSVLRNVTVRRYATPKKMMAAVRAYANNLLVEDVTVEENAFAGMSAIGDDIVFRGIVAQDNGQNGLHGHFANNLLVDTSRILRNNREQFDPFWASGGMKVTTSPGFVFSNNYVAENFGPGVWTDLEVRDGSIHSNFFERNTRSAIEIELSAYMVVTNNVAIDNGEAGVYVLESSDVDVWNNGFFGNAREIRIFEGNRAVPTKRDPRVEWEVRRVTVYNNSIGPSADGKESIQVAADGSLPVKPTGATLGVVANNNAYWNLNDGSNLSQWLGDAEVIPRYSTDLPSHRTQSTQDGTSTESVADENPIAVDPTANDFRHRDAPAGAAVPERVSKFLGVRPESALPIGPRTPSDNLDPLAPEPVQREAPTPAPPVAPPATEPAAGAGTGGGDTVVAPPVDATVPSTESPAAGNQPFIATAPFRLLDSRPGQTTSDGQFAGIGAVASGSVVEFQVAGRGPVPADAAGVVLNATSAGAAEDGFYTFFPCNGETPTASNVNYATGTVQANAAVVSLSATGTVCAFVQGSSDMIVDTTGYIPPDSYLATFSPVRLADTRQSGGPQGAGATLKVKVAGVNGVPANTTGAVVNLTAVRPKDTGFATVYPCGGDLPNASSLNYKPDQAVAALLVAPIGDDGSICVYTNTPSNVIVDMSGYLFPTDQVRLTKPARILDTRANGETADNQYAGIGERPDGFILSLDAAGRAGIPDDAEAVLMSVISVKSQAAGEIRLYPCGQPRPEVSNLSYPAGGTVSAFVVVEVGTNGQVCVHNSRATQIIVDVTGSL